MKQRTQVLCQKWSMPSTLSMCLLLAACGGGGSGSDSPAPTQTAPVSIAADNQFSSSLKIQSSNGIVLTVADNKANTDEARLAYAVAKQPNSVLQTGVFSIPASGNTVAGSVTVIYDNTTQKLRAVVYQALSGATFACSEVNLSNNRCTEVNGFSYNVATGAMQINFNNQVLKNNNTVITQNLNGRLSGSLRTAPLQFSDLLKTSQSNLKIDQASVRVQSIQADNFSSPIMTLILEDGREIYSYVFTDEAQKLVGEVSLYDPEFDNSFFLDTPQASNTPITVTANNSEKVAVSFDRALLRSPTNNDTYLLSGNFSVNKPIASLTLNGLDLEGTTAPFVDYFSTLLNQYVIRNFTIQQAPNAESTTYVRVVSRAGKVTTVTIGQEANDTIVAEYLCDDGLKIPCTGAVVSSNGSRVTFNNTPMATDTTSIPVLLNGTLVGFDR